MFVRACISDTVRDFRVYNSRALSSVTETILYDNPEHYRLERIEKLTTRRLEDILAEHNAPNKFEFLSIDVEGHDSEVLQSIDLGQYQPEVIVIEVSGEMSVGAISECAAAKHLSSYGYEPVAALNSPARRRWMPRHATRSNLTRTWVGSDIDFIANL